MVQAAKNGGIQEVFYEERQGRSHYKYTSHALGHSFTVHWLQNGGSMEGLFTHMAHSSITITEVYTGILEERRKGA